MDIGNKIKKLRLKAGATQEMLAQELNISCQSVSKWENNICSPDISLLPKLSVYFGVTIDELFDMSVDQKLNRIEHMLDYESVLSDEEFHNTVKFLNEQLDTYEGEPGEIYSFLARVYHHRILSDSKKVSDYARKAMRLHPELKQDQWLLNEAEGAVKPDWNYRNHNKTIVFYRELVENHPDIGRNYQYLMDNLLADNRTEEAGKYLERYKRLTDKKEYLVPGYEARIALAEHHPEEAEQIIRRMEEQYPEDEDALFEIADFYAGICDYEKAILYYEKSYEMDEKPRFYDALQGQAIIYEIQGKYEEAIRTWDRIQENLQEEWGCTEGAPIVEVELEKQRLRKLKK